MQQLENKKASASSTDSAQVEAESGVLSGSISTPGNDINASGTGNNYIQFGTPSGQIAYPPDQIGLSALTVQKIPMPAYLQTTTDPTVGNLITRVSDMTAFGTTNLLLTHEYTKIQTWNADESLLFFAGWYWNTGYVLDGKTGAYLRTVHPGSLGGHSSRWSNVNPNNMYGISSTTVGGGACNNTNRMVVWHPLTDTTSAPPLTLLHTFAQYDSYTNTSQCANMTFGLEEGNFSNDDSMGAVIGWSTAQNSWGITTFRMTNTNTLTPTVTEIATAWLGATGGTSNNPDAAGWNNIVVAPKGGGVIIQWNSSASTHSGLEWYDTNLTTLKHLANSHSHYDVGLDSNGNEMVVTDCGQPGGPATNECDGVSQAPGAPFIAGYYINSNGPTGQTLNLYPQGSASLTQTVHISCRNQSQRPGWCYISDMTNDPTKSIGYEQIYALKLDGSRTVEVFAVDHGSNNTCSSCNQYAARVVPTHDGTRVLFDSDSGAGSSSPAYDYIAQWPYTPSPTSTCSATPPAGDGTDTATITLPIIGNYLLWSRMRAPITGNSYYLQIDNGCPIQVTDDGNISQWNWISSLPVQMNAGQHTIKLLGNQNAVAVDRLIFSQSCTPTGTGDNCLNAPSQIITPTPLLSVIPSLTPSILPTATPTLIPTLIPTSTPLPTNTPTPTPPATIIAQDTFQRANRTFWGTANDGHTWGADAATNAVFSIANNVGQIKNAGTALTGTIGSTAINAQIFFRGSLSSFSNSNIGGVLHYTDGNNWYKGYIDGSNLVLQKRVSGTTTTVKTVAFSAKAGTNYSLRFQIVGSTLSMKVWATSSTEPINWTTTANDSSLKSGLCGLRVQAIGTTASYTSFSATAL